LLLTIAESVTEGWAKWFLLRISTFSKHRESKIGYIYTNCRRVDGFGGILAQGGGQLKPQG